MQLFTPAQAPLFRALLAIALLLTTWATLTPSPVPLAGGSDKLAHAATFVLLAWLADAAWPARRPRWTALLLLALYGGGIELIQGTVPNREPSLADLIANIAGLAGYSFLIGPWLRNRFYSP